MSDFKERAAAYAKFFTNRIFIIAVCLILIFAILVSALFEQMIVHGTYNVPTLSTFTRTIPINAPRGQIFDVHGRPLAVNMPVYIIMMDPSVAREMNNEQLSRAFLFFINIMSHHGEEIDIEAEFFLSDDLPRAFTAPSETVRMRWLNDIIGEEANAGMTATEAYTAMLEFFDIPSGLGRDTELTLLNLHVALYLQRFNLHQVRLATDISTITMAAIEEHSNELPGLYIATDYMRYYPAGRYMTNIVGFMRTITEGQLAAHSHLGYSGTDLFGQTGAEIAFELYLRGQRGEIEIEVDSSFRRLAVLNERAPVPGDDIYLTVDSHLQRAIYYIIEDTLSQILINRLGNTSQAVPFTREILGSMFMANNIDAIAIMQSDDALPASYAIRQFVLSSPSIEEDELNNRPALNRLLDEAINAGHVNVIQVFNAMYEQGILSVSFDMALAQGLVPGGGLGPSTFMISRIEAREITPHTANVDPSTASVVVLDIHTGGVIAAVNYPTFDGNRLLPHKLDVDYFVRINNDPTLPQFNRAFSEAAAPGSTFKMITALAALSQGIINPETRIFDNRVFRSAGRPYLHCWIHPHTHGNITVAEAIAHSCNYFFNRVAFNMGNHTTGATLQGIATLNHYMSLLGLGAPTGIEIPEMNMFTAAGTPRIASPAYYAGMGGPPWTDGLTAQVSIGQGLNNYTSASMAKYMATLANGGTRYQMHLLNRRVSAGGAAVYTEPVVEAVLDIEPEHLQAIHNGMLLTTTAGTGQAIFRGFPMQVGVKSGTAETGTAVSHSTYTGFAPFDNPQIAVYVMVPHGDSTFLRGSSGHLLREVFAEYFGLNRGNDINIDFVIN